MVLIEVDKKFPHNERLLGEHRWSEVLKKPTDEEKQRVSQVFHCLYTTGREAQKDGACRSTAHLLPALLTFDCFLLGWKRIHVEAPWFKEWSSGTV